jgi:hypothetical protein
MIGKQQGGIPPDPLARAGDQGYPSIDIEDAGQMNLPAAENLAFSVGDLSK